MVNCSLALQDRLGARPERQAAIGIGAKRVAGDQRPRHRPDQRHLVGRWRSRTPTGGDGRTAHLLIVVAGQHRRRDGATPNRISVRNAADSNLRATSVASMVAGGSRQLSQLPQCSGGSSPKWRSRIARRQVAASTKAASAFSRSRSAGRRAGSTSSSIRRRAWAKSSAPQNSQRLGRLAVAPGAAGLLVVGLDRLGDRRHGRRSARRACRCPCRRRRSPPSPSLRMRRTPPGCARAPAARARHDRAAPAVPSRPAAPPASRPCRGSVHRRSPPPAGHRAAL